tara:strand:- start:2489 stop:3067 length:579 start_codon:yes stop_codon:yes gene_type:complete
MAIKQKIKFKETIAKVLEKKPKFDLIELPWIDCSEDPVRPDLDLSFRQAYGRKIFGLRDEEKDIAAIICFAFTNQVPKTIEEMDAFSKDAAMQAIHRAGVQGQIAIAYTVWSKKKGGGRAIVNEVYKMIKRSSHLNRLVTLSPLTDMARNFHLKNGAKELQVNEKSQNFEYDISLEQWEKYFERAKSWIKFK